MGSVRIVGGRWRGSRLPVPDAPGLRPTSDRARETLFNWLQPWLPGARVLATLGFPPRARTTFAGALSEPALTPRTLRPARAIAAASAFAYGIGVSDVDTTRCWNSS